MQKAILTLLISAAAVIGLAACDGASPALHQQHNTSFLPFVFDGDDSPVKLVGEKLFREPRFSQYFYTHSKNNNTELGQGDVVVASLETITNAIVNPDSKVTAISCASCHFVDQNADVANAGQRAYTDFARRSPVPDLQDGQTHTARNSPTMVGSSIRDGLFLHHDGEFATPEDLIHASMTGRNMGWRVDQGDLAKKHIIDILKSDDGSYPTDTDINRWSYAQIFAGDPSIPRKFQIPAEYRLTFALCTDDQIYEGMVKLVAGYMRTLDFKKDASGANKGSPYDQFLINNGLPRVPADDETPVTYSERLLKLLTNLPNPTFVVDGPRTFELHDQKFEFGAKELAGLKTFLGSGKCIQCHAAPEFTDHLFHNTGSSQFEYEKIHGDGSFAKLKIPNLKDRLAKYDAFLPANALHPLATGNFRSAPNAADKNRADLGVWNVFANPAMPVPQERLRLAICQSLDLDCTKATDSQLLDASIGMIKTPTLRDLGHSQPYLHTGQMDNIEDVLKFYQEISIDLQAGKIRNADPKLSTVRLQDAEVDTVAAFLRSLNEDYN